MLHIKNTFSYKSYYSAINMSKTMLLNNIMIVEGSAMRIAVAFHTLTTLISGRYLSHCSDICSWAESIVSRYLIIVFLKSSAFLKSNASTSFLINLDILSKFSCAISCSRSNSAISCRNVAIASSFWPSSALTLASRFLVNLAVVCCQLCHALTLSYDMNALFVDMKINKNSFFF